MLVKKVQPKHSMVILGLDFRPPGKVGKVDSSIDIVILV